MLPSHESEPTWAPACFPVLAPACFPGRFFITHRPVTAHFVGSAPSLRVAAADSNVVDPIGTVDDE